MASYHPTSPVDSIMSISTDFYPTQIYLRPSTDSSNDTPGQILQHLNCIICLELLKDPVTTSCGHTFCSSCLQRNIRNNPNCPLCKNDLHDTPHVNILLKEIITLLHEAQNRPPNPDDFTGEEGQVACDICPVNGRKKAVKSCLTCTQSYCTQHITNHQRGSHLKGHQLVEPCAELEQRSCPIHARPLVLYAPNEERCICSSCVEEGMKVVSVEKERSKKQKLIDDNIKQLKDKIQSRVQKMREFDSLAKKCLNPIEKDIKEINDIFDAIVNAVEFAKKRALLPLQDRKRQVETESDTFKSSLRNEIEQFEKVISDLQNISRENDPVCFLQRYSTNMALQDGQDWSDVVLDTNVTFGPITSTRLNMMANIEAQLNRLSRMEMARIKKFAVDVTLDPNTANLELHISNDLKEVMSLQERPEQAARSETDSCRFDLFASILAQNWITEGKAFWEVDVGSKAGWDIGVAREDADRRGQLRLEPSEGYWVIVHFNDEHYSAMEDPPTVLLLPEKPERVGVFVDFQEKMISFYNMNTEARIHSFTDCEFGAGVKPYFSPHLKEQRPLILCPVSP